MYAFLHLVASPVSAPLRGAPPSFYEGGSSCSTSSTFSRHRIRVQVVQLFLQLLLTVLGKIIESRPPKCSRRQEPNLKARVVYPLSYRLLTYRDGIISACATQGIRRIRATRLFLRRCG